MTRKGRIRALALATGLALALGGCTSPNAGVTPVQAAGSTENPPTGPAVRIAQVRDQRQFQDYEGTSFTPTLAGDADRSRAVARNTSPGGAPAGNVLLAPGLSVESVVSDAMARALRSAGFRVLGAGDAGADEATELRITIQKLWVIRRFSASGGEADSEFEVRIAGPIGGLDRGAVISAHKLVARAFWTPSLFRLALEKGLDELTNNAIPELEAARLAVGADGGD